MSPRRSEAVEHALDERPEAGTRRSQEAEPQGVGGGGTIGTSRESHSSVALSTPQVPPLSDCPAPAAVGVDASCTISDAARPGSCTCRQKEKVQIQGPRHCIFTHLGVLPPLLLHSHLDLVTPSRAILNSQVRDAVCLIWDRGWLIIRQRQCRSPFLLVLLPLGRDLFKPAFLNGWLPDGP